jgi:hypothetical protein
MRALILEAEQLSDNNPKSTVNLIRQFWEIFVDDLSSQLNLDFNHDRDV